MSARSSLPPFPMQQRRTSALFGSLHLRIEICSADDLSKHTHHVPYNPIVKVNLYSDFFQISPNAPQASVAC